jgi:hypothetical protein
MLGPCIAPNNSKLRSSNFAARIANSKLNSSVESAKRLRLTTARIVSKAKMIELHPRRSNVVNGKDRPGPNRRDYSHLPVVEELRELPQERRVCPHCAAALSPSDTEDSDFLVRDIDAGQDQHSHIADVVSGELRGKPWTGSDRHRPVFAVGDVDGKAPRDGHRSQRQFMNFSRGRFPIPFEHKQNRSPSHVGRTTAHIQRLPESARLVSLEDRPEFSIRSR